MSTIFMQWVKNDVGEIFIRQFESFVSRFLGNGHTSCIFQESCKDNLVEAAHEKRENVSR